MRNGLKINYRGDKFWYLDDKLHREDGPAIELANGIKEYWINGELHREDGPAIEFPDRKFYYHHGELHRLDGPAVEYPNGINEYWINNKYLNVKSQKEFKRLVKLLVFN